MQASVPVFVVQAASLHCGLLAGCQAAETARVAVSRASAGITAEGKFPEAA
jgi:hypothetical protein